ncbi:MAG: feruloyl-CoA synthase [Thiolinea sp.]
MALSRVDYNNPDQYRPVEVGGTEVEVSRLDNGGWEIHSAEALQPYPDKLTERLVSGAEHYPDRTLTAKRDADGEWVRISYADMLNRVRAIAQNLHQRNLSAERPIMILSGNDLEHLQLSLAAMYAGVPYCAVSPASALLSKDYAKLRHMAELLTPGLVFADDGSAYAAAIDSCFAADTDVVVVKGEVTNREVTLFSEMLATEPADIDEVHAAVGPDTIAKFVFTSGSTKLPKAVTTTQRMLCSNQQMLQQIFRNFAETPPVILDWLPWNHTFGGSHNVGLVLYNGGTLYINDGKPTDSGFAETLTNLKEISPTLHLDVPKSWEMLADALEHDAELRESFYANMQVFFFAGAGLSQAAWDKLDHISEEHCGCRIRVMTGLGMTETSPSSLFSTGPLVGSGYLGLPSPGCEARLVPVDGKLEARFRGPHVMPGYWRDAVQTAEVFDEDNFYCTGDAINFANPDQPELGCVFDGRIAEDFKLNSGTFVSVGPLRAKLIAAGAPYIQDAVITGINRDSIGALLIPRMEHIQKLAGASADTPADAMLYKPEVMDFFRKVLAEVNSQATGSASRIARLMVLAEPPSVELHELTDKGSINQRAVLKNRAGLIEAFYNDQPADRIIKHTRS